MLEIYWNKVKNSDYLISNLKNLFLMRFSAFRFIADADENKKNLAKNFLIQTMTLSEAEYDFPTKEALANKVEHWEFPEIVAQRSDEELHAIVYKMNYLSKGKKLSHHEICFFEKDNEQNFKFTYKYDLAELAKKYCPTNTTALLQTHQLDDPLLHKKAISVANFSSYDQNSIHEQIKILKADLCATSEVSIAANQCSSVLYPWKIILSGVDYANPEHTVKALLRYPSTLFPALQAYINPLILALSNESVIIGYQTITGSRQIKKFTGQDARMMLHKLDHLN